jgi:hypothetical protein
MASLLERSGGASLGRIKPLMDNTIVKINLTELLLKFTDRASQVHGSC